MRLFDEYAIGKISEIYNRELPIRKNLHGMEDNPQ